MFFIIHSDINISASLEAKLRLEGFRVVVSNGGEIYEELMCKIEINRPDFIISGLDLINIDALQLFRDIRDLESNEENFHPLILVYSNLEKLKDKVIDVGVNFFISEKDVRIDALVLKIKKILEKNK